MRRLFVIMVIGATAALEGCYHEPYAPVPPPPHHVLPIPAPHHVLPVPPPPHHW